MIEFNDDVEIDVRLLRKAKRNVRRERALEEKRESRSRKVHAVESFQRMRAHQVRAMAMSGDWE